MSLLEDLGIARLTPSGIRRNDNWQLLMLKNRHRLFRDTAFRI